MKKRLVLRQPPDSRVLREAMKLAHEHLEYIDWLVDNRAWLAGATMSLADLAAAAQISVADYLGGIDWTGHEQSARLVFGVQEPPELPPAAYREDGGDPAAGPLRASGRLRAGPSLPISVVKESLP